MSKYMAESPYQYKLRQACRSDIHSLVNINGRDSYSRIISQYISPEVARGAEVRVHEGAVGHVSAAETHGSGHVAAGGHVEAVHLLVLGRGGGPAQEEAATGNRDIA